MSSSVKPDGSAFTNIGSAHAGIFSTILSILFLKLNVALICLWIVFPTVEHGFESNNPFF
jgi:hypothetical protein